MPPAKQSFPTKSSSIVTEIRELLINADEWLDAPNDQLSGARPWDLIGTPQEELLRNLIQAAKYGVAGQ